MTEREKPVDFTNTKTCLWLRESDGSYKNTITTDIRKQAPRQSLGGILADDMYV